MKNVRKPRTSKQIAQAGLTLGVGMIALPFIPFKEAKTYKPFKKKHIELSPWKTPLGIGRNNKKEIELEAYYDADDLAQIKKQKQRRREE